MTGQRGQGKDRRNEMTREDKKSGGKERKDEMSGEVRRGQGRRQEECLERKMTGTGGCGENKKEDKRRENVLQQATIPRPSLLFSPKSLFCPSYSLHLFFSASVTLPPSLHHRCISSSSTPLTI